MMISCVFNANAQKATLEVSAGGAISFVSKKAISTHFSPVATLVGGFNFYKPVNEKWSIKTGLLYQQKGVNYSSEVAVEKSETVVQTKVRTTLHYMSIPLQLGYSWQDKNNKIWRASFGMNYGFLLHAHTRQKVSNYENGIFRKDSSYSFSNYVAASRSRDEKRGNDRTELYLFTPSLRTDLSYQFHKKLSLFLFYEYNLSDVSSNGGVGRINLHTMGLKVGYTF